ncbi:N-acetylmuramoyl-L-alanine amidase [Aspergillus bombycis]|uniref:N-acetylmuramoyl-L-alanine amidase n=1 Tax=Aspergillus bombycis TaxID=109264 RepID=A0A1F7ZSW1_9EURO|nr:N-acetylmuramoyl-L-alanine amidase [Aspergillus bombycis]OGM42359.1 N-acetylmuramoyl-L-alanine amidase [Aspergillus bombycis]
MASHMDIHRAVRSPVTLFILLSYLMMIPGVLAMNFVSREEWKARAPKEAYKPITDAKGVKNQHMDESPEDYFDIAYNLAVCEHGYIFDGRGKGHRSGANGNVQLNSDHYAVLAFLGKQGVTEPSDAQITGLQDSIAYLRRAGAGDEIKGHRDGYNTECPGGPLYKLVIDGSLDPGTLWDGGSHTVQKGEDLDTISSKYNVPKQHIISANDLQSPYHLTVNQTIEVPARGVPLPQSDNR